MENPFQILDLPYGADADAVRAAYRKLVRTCHPDLFQDPAEREEAQKKMIRLNLAYEQALRLTGPSRGTVQSAEELPTEEALKLAEKMMQQGHPDRALRQLLRAEEKNAAWYGVQGEVLLAMEQYHAAHQSFREAIRLSPDNNRYRSGALKASVAEQKEQTLQGKIKKLFKKKIVLPRIK